MPVWGVLCREGQCGDVLAWGRSTRPSVDRGSIGRAQPRMRRHNAAHGASRGSVEEKRDKPRRGERN
jgi:hypothetical protein